MADQRHGFGPFVLDVPRGQLLRDGKAVAVGQRGLALLQALLDANGEVVAKDALMERAWPGAVVEEGNLTVQIAALRRALGDGPAGQPWIATVPRVGYRLLRANGPAEPGTPGRPALAVLPFESLGGDDGQADFADGVATEIIAALSRFHAFAVVARSSSFAYRGRALDARRVAGELGVRYVLEGSVRQAGEALRITVQFVDGGTGTHLWGETFDGTRAEGFAFQERIAGRVAALVEPSIGRAEADLARRERPGSVAAYDVNLHALPRIMRESPQENAAVYTLLTEALALEPDDPQLLAYAAFALFHLRSMGWPPIGPDDTATCIELARRALENAAGDASVMAMCGVALLHVAKDYDWGMAVFRAAMETNPINPQVITMAGVAHLHCGDVGTALEYLHRAMRLGPRHPFAYVTTCGIAHAQMILGDYPEALIWADRSRTLNPNFDCAHWMLTAANAHLGRMEAARRFRDELRRLVPGITIAKIRAGQPAKDPGRIAAILEGLRLAGLEEG